MGCSRTMCCAGAVCVCNETIRIGTHGFFGPIYSLGSRNLIRTTPDCHVASCWARSRCSLTSQVCCNSMPASPAAARSVSRTRESSQVAGRALERSWCWRWATDPAGVWRGRCNRSFTVQPVLHTTSKLLRCNAMQVAPETMHPPFMVIHEHAQTSAAQRAAP